MFIRQDWILLMMAITWLFHSVSSPHFTAWPDILVSCLHHPCQDKENLPWLRKIYSNRFVRTMVASTWTGWYHPTKYINVIFYLIILTHPQDINPKVVWVGFLPRFGAQCEQLRAFGARTPVNCTKFRPRMGIGVGFMETAKIPKDGLPNHGQTLWMQFCTMCTYMQIKCIVWTHIIHCVEDMACIWAGTHLKALSVTLKSKSHQWST